MQLEVEIKAWVRDLPALEAKLRAMGAIVEKHYDKADTYFRYERGGVRHDVRIRMVDGHSLVTYKDKSINDGLEVNREYEFSVSDPSAMTELLLRLGAEVLVEKRKIGTSWKLPASEVHIEVSEVVGLGTFIEIEAIIDPEGLIDDEKSLRVRASETRIRGLLRDAGIPDGDIESRTYTSMLLHV